MEKFAFIIHPLSIHDMAHVSPVLKFIPDSWLESALKLKKPFQVSHITGIKSPYAEAEGWFIGCPLTSKQMVELPEEFVMDRIINQGRSLRNWALKCRPGRIHLYRWRCRHHSGEKFRYSCDIGQQLHSCNSTGGNP